MKKIFFVLITLIVSSCMDTPTKAPLMETTKANGEPSGPHTSVEWKIWALSTAAPSFIAKNCTVIDADGKTVLREGTNGWTAMAGNPRECPILRMDGKMRTKQCLW